MLFKRVTPFVLSGLTAAVYGIQCPGYLEQEIHALTLLNLLSLHPCPSKN